MKKGIFIAALGLGLALAGCGSDGDGGTGGDSGEKVNTVTYAATAGSTTINSSMRTDLTVSSSNSTINIETNIRKLNVSGFNNLLNFSDGVKVETCTLTGTDNTASKTGTVTMACTDIGSGNTGF